MEADEARNPVAVGAFGPKAVMFQSHYIAHLIEQFPFGLALNAPSRYNGLHDSVFIGLLLSKQAD